MPPEVKNGNLLSEFPGALALALGATTSPALTFGAFAAARATKLSKANVLQFIAISFFEEGAHSFRWSSDTDKV
jgi:hypothetical protein